MDSHSRVYYDQPDPNPLTNEVLCSKSLVLFDLFSVACYCSEAFICKILMRSSLLGSLQFKKF